MILCVGEILVDLIGNVTNGTIEYATFAGGAPFNVACGIKQFEGKVKFAGNVGQDLMGKFLVDFAKLRNFDTDLITIDRNHNTTLAFVKNDKFGERSFSFYRTNTADYFINEAIINEIKNVDIVHLGSLMLSEVEGRQIADLIVSETKRLSKLLSFDINFRDDIFPNQDEAIRIYQKYAFNADIIKYSLEELELFSGTKDIEAGLKSIVKPNQLAFLTLGKDGSIFYHNGKLIKETSINVIPIDTTGAGDAFYAGVLTKLDEISMNEFVNDELVIKQVLKFANIAGALTTTKKGAIAAIPSLTMINEYLEMK